MKARASRKGIAIGSRKDAIDSKCRDCIYDENCPGTWRQQVEACESDDCALWPFRPKSAGEKAERREESDPLAVRK